MHRRAVLIGVAVAVVLVLAAGWRFYDITNYPPGLFPDEAANGEDALLILSGDIRHSMRAATGAKHCFFTCRQHRFGGLAGECGSCTSCRVSSAC